MKLILPDNRNVTPVILPEVAKKLQDIYRINVEEQVSESEYHDGELTVREWFKHWVDLSPFPYAYYMGDGITKAIDLTKLEYQTDWGVLQGDYEWPLAFGNNKRKRQVHQLDESINYLTQPFAGSGMLWSLDDLSCIKGKVILDMAYISTCSPGVVDLPNNVDRVFLGASKSLGTPFLRHGWMFSKTAIPSLDLFFKSIRYFSYFGFRAGIKLYASIDPVMLSEQGFNYQRKIFEANPGYNFKGDSWLIANTDINLGEHLKRGNVYRVPLGLTIKQMLF